MREVSVDEKLRILRPFLGPKRSEALRQLYFLEDNPYERKIVEARIDTLISRVAKQSIDTEVILPPPNPKACQGDIKLGRVEYLGNRLHPYHLRLRDVNRHMGIFGSTGTGKTTLAAHIITELYRARVPVMVIGRPATGRLPGSFLTFTCSPSAFR